jgi:hypothetical protein
VERLLKKELRIFQSKITDLLNASGMIKYNKPHLPYILRRMAKHNWFLLSLYSVFRLDFMVDLHIPVKRERESISLR